MLMAAMLPISMLLLLAFVIVMVLMLFAAVANERRLIRIISNLQRSSVNG